MPILDFLRRLTGQPTTEVIDLTPMLEARDQETTEDAPPAAVMQSRQRWVSGSTTPADIPTQGDLSR
jgi:hypothetical protein